MAITYSAGVYTLSTSGNYTPTDLYSYNSAGITRLNGSRIVYDFGSSRIIVGSGTTLTIDTTLPTILINFGNGTFNYGALNINHTINFTVTDINLDSCWVEYNETNSSDLGCSSGVLEEYNLDVAWDIWDFSYADSYVYGGSTFSPVYGCYFSENGEYLIMSGFNTTTYKSALKK